MAGETFITVVGNLTSDPEFRITPSGVALAKFSVASTPRTFDKNSNSFKDGEPLFLGCQVWREPAENVAESLSKGDRVIVQGRLKQNNYEDKEGVKRTFFSIDVEEIGPALRFRIAKPVRSNGDSGGSGGANSSRGNGASRASQPDDRSRSTKGRSSQDIRQFNEDTDDEAPW